MCYNLPHATDHFLSRGEAIKLVVVNRMRWGQTIVPNAFIDKYLVKAGGEYVKVYLMLLRMMDEPVSVAGLADALEFTEKDVIRALSYWEKAGLLSLDFEGGELTQLVMMDLPEEKDGAADGGTTLTLAAAPAPAKEAAPAKESAPEKAKKEKTKSAEKLLDVDGDFKQLIFVIEQYLEKTLTKAETEDFIWMRTKGGLCIDVIEYLVEYCVSMGKTNVRYIRAVAEDWSKKGIADVKQAKEEVKSFSEKTKDKGKTKNKFHNFEQRDDDINELMYEELRDAK